MRLRLNVRIMASCLLVLAGLTACGGPLIPDKDLVDQFLATRSMELVKEVNIRYFAVSDEFYYGTRKYPAFVPLLDNPGQGVLVLPTPNNMSGSKYQMAWFPESEIRVSGDYGSIQAGDFLKLPGWTIQTYSEKTFSGGPELSLASRNGTPLLSVIWMNGTMPYSGALILDSVSSPAIDQHDSIAGRIVPGFQLSSGTYSPDSNRSIALAAIGGLLAPLTIVYNTGNPTSVTLDYWPLTYTPPPGETLGLTPTSQGFSAPGPEWFSSPGTVLLQKVNGLVPDYTGYVMAFHNGTSWKRMRMDTFVASPMADSPYRPLHAENNVVVLETDDQGKFFLPEQGNKEINTPGMKFLQAYRKANGELWFLFTQTIRSATNHEGTTLRTWGYKY